MILIDVELLAGRYHATPWDHHVNEGVVEWPPSPWRLLRALLAVWLRKASADIDEATMRGLLENLASTLPSYVLPAASASHTRHYMPQFKGSTSKVFDAFLHVSGPLQVQWPVELDGPSHTALALLLERMSYLGRAESWASLRLGASAGQPNAVAGESGEGERIRLLAPSRPDDYLGWCAGMIDEMTTLELAAKRRKKPEREPKLSKAERQKIEQSVPTSLFDALLLDTAEIRGRGWNRPPGSRWVSYTRDADVGTVPRRRRRRSGARPTVARYQLSGPVPPRLTDALGFAERVRRVVLKLSNGASVFVGREEGMPMHGHRHASFLPEALAGGGAISHLTIWAPMGFDQGAATTLRELPDRIKKRTRNHHYSLVLERLGQPEDFDHVEHRRLAGATLGRSLRWCSVTPFVPTRHPKKRVDSSGLAIGSPEHDLRRLASLAGLPEIRRVRPLAHAIVGGRRTSWLSFRTQRQVEHGRRGASRGFGFEIELASPWRGPLALGYGAHFGLGLFAPCDES